MTDDPATRNLLDWLKAEKRPEITERLPRARVSAESPVPELPPHLFDEGELGRGGMSSVRRVRDETLLRRVAMKVLDPRLAQEPRERQRFREEAQITGQLEHPHIPPIYGLGTDAAGTHWFTMKLVEGRTLDQLLRDAEFTPADEIALFRMLDVFLRVCQAVSFAHARGVLHLDIKASNVMVGSHGQVYLTDWGISRLVGAARPSEGARVRLAQTQPGEATGHVLGTVAYMSPEQARGLTEAFDARTDVFALGALLYRILAGRALYDAATSDALVRLAEEADIEWPQVVRPDVALPQRLCDVAMKALSREQKDRHASVDALIADVEGFLRGDGRFRQQRYPKGALVVKECEYGDAAFVIARGRAVAFKTVDGERQVLREMGPGEIFGETAILTDGARTASVEALEPLVLTVVSRTSLEQEIGQCHWMGRVVKSLAERFRDVDGKASHLRASLHRDAFAAEVLRAFALHGEGPAARRTMGWEALVDEIASRLGIERGELAERLVSQAFVVREGGTARLTEVP